MRTRLARTAWLLAAVAALAAEPAGTQPVEPRGDRLDPGALDPFREPDPRGMTSLRASRRRSPTGFLYPYPPETWRGYDLGGGFLASGAFEAGVLEATGDTSETRFGHYADWSDGFSLRWLDAKVLAPARGWYGSFASGDAGRDDAFYTADLGVAGLVRLRGTVSQTPYHYANDAHLVFDGAGSDRLTLRPPLVPGGNSESALAAALASAGNSELTVEHDETRIELDVRPRDGLKLFARYGQDERDGEKPFGGSLGYPGLTELAETVEPIQQVTRQGSVGLEWASERVQSNLSYQVSFFHNQNDSLRFDVPLDVGDPDIQQGRFALAPDNAWHDVRGDVAVSLPFDGRFTTTVSWSRARQDDELLPPTINDGTVGRGPFGTIDLAQWSQSASRARDRADAAIDVLLVDAALHASPWRPLRLGARFRLLDQDYDTSYTAYNPLTNQFGYITEDGGLAAQTPERRVFPLGRSSFEDFRYRSLPTSYRTWLSSLSADWRVLDRTSLQATLEREAVQREIRERSETREYRARLALSSRQLDFATLRLSGEVGRRSGSGYDSYPFPSYFASSLPGYVPTTGVVAPYALDALRMHDLADRDYARTELRVNWLLRDDMDASLMAGWLDQSFGTDYGLTSQQGFDASAEWSWQASPNTSAYAFYGVELGWRKMAAISSSGVLNSADGSAGGPVFPLANEWSVDSEELSQAVGVGLQLRPHPRLTLDLSYSFLATSTEFDYELASPAALGQGIPATGVGDGFPSLRLLDQVLLSQLRVTLTDHIEVAFLYRFEHSTIADFHQTKLTPLVDPGAIFLGHVDRDFNTHLFGAWVRVGF